MKRFFPRAIPEALALLSFAMLAGAGCAPDQGVQPGAPVLTKLSIVEPSGNRVDITADTKACVGFVATVPDGGADAATTDGAAGDASASEAGAADASASEAGASDAGASEAGASDASASEAGTSDGGTTPSTVKEGDECDPAADGVCTLDGVTCHCVAKDMCDPSIDKDNATTSGTLACTYAPMSMVIAVFDRLLDTTPFTDDKGQATLAPAAKAAADPIPGTPFTITGDYRSTGSPKDLFFTAALGDEPGPAIRLNGSPGFPTLSEVSATLDPQVVRAKDGKTPFAAMGGLADGKVSFKTAPFALDGITTPVPPAPMADTSSGGGMMMGCPGMMPATDDGGTDAATADGAATDGQPDGGIADAAATEVGIDAAATEVGIADAAATEVAANDAATDVGASDAAADVAGEAAAPPPTDVQPDMNKGAVTIAFNNPVGKDIKSHIKVTKDGAPFTDFDITGDDAFPTATVTITPTKDKSTPPDPTKDETWTAGSTYGITVDASAADVFGATTGAEQSASFTMSKN